MTIPKVARSMIGHGLIGLVLLAAHPTGPGATQATIRLGADPVIGGPPDTGPPVVLFEEFHTGTPPP
jgi:hypothetical protein